MAIAGAVVVPVNKQDQVVLLNKLNQTKGVEVQKVGPRGIAVVLEAAGPGELKKISEQINKWEEVIEFELVYLNWEET